MVTGIKGHHFIFYVIKTISQEVNNDMVNKLVSVTHCEPVSQVQLLALEIVAPLQLIV